MRITSPTPSSALSNRSEDDLPVHSLRTLLLDPATVTLNVASTAINLRGEDQRDDPPHAAAGQSLRAARRRSGVFPVAPRPVSKTSH